MGFVMDWRRRTALCSLIFIASSALVLIVIYYANFRNHRPTIDLHPTIDVDYIVYVSRPDSRPSTVELGSRYQHPTTRNISFQTTASNSPEQPLRSDWDLREGAGATVQSFFPHELSKNGICNIDIIVNQNASLSVSINGKSGLIDLGADGTKIVRFDVAPGCVRFSVKMDLENMDSGSLRILWSGTPGSEYVKLFP